MTKKEAADFIDRKILFGAYKENKEYNDALTMAINALMAEPCEDCISRQAVMGCFKKWQPYMATRLFEFEKELFSLQPVTPAKKVGHWIEKDGYDGDTYYDCSECGESWSTIDGTPWNNGMKYCPNCGAKMEKVKE